MNIDTIIHKFLLKNESKEELEQLENWKLESEANIKALEELQLHWKAFESLKGYHNYDSDQAWSNINDKIGRPERKLRRLTWVSAAAALLIVMAIIYFISVPNPSSLPLQYVSNSEKIEANLPDQTKIWLNKNSAIDYSDFSLTSRTINFNRGEAYFDVRSNPEIPFHIYMGKYHIKVVGTEFNLQRQSDDIHLQVTEGMVVFSTEDREIMVAAGEMLIADSHSMDKAKFKSANVAAWKRGILIFKNTILQDALKDLSRYYGIDIKLKSNADFSLHCILNTTFTDETLEEMLQELKTVYGIQYRIAEKGVIITETDCN